MSRPGAKVRASHAGLGVVLALGAVVVVLTGFSLRHPGWFGPRVAAPGGLAADPGTPGRVLRTAPRLQESRDGGHTWSDLPEPPGEGRPLAVAIAPDSAGAVWLLEQGALLRGDAAARTWTPVLLPPAAAGAAAPRELTVTADGIPVVAGALGAWAADGDGGTWRTLWVRHPGRGERLQRWVHDVHTGEWGIALVPRIYDGGAILFLGVIATGWYLGTRRGGRKRRS